MNYSAQNTITIKRLRSSDSLSITFDGNSVPLFQGVDEKTGAVNPDWTKEGNQPIRTPKVVSARGLGVTLTGHTWTYNGLTLIFNGAASGDWVTDSTGKFQLNTTNGGIKIIKNLASTTNIANDTLIYSCVATVAGVEYTLTKELPIAIQSIGSNSYYLAITSTTEQLTSAVTSCVLSTKLFISGGEVTDYYVKWYKDDTAWADKNGQKNVTVTRDDVSGAQLFIAEVYKSSTDTKVIARAGIRVLDTADEFQVVCYITSTQKEVDTDKPVTVAAKIVRMSTNETYTPSSATWKLSVMEKETWTEIKTSATNSIVVTTTETDRGGEYYDVDVVAEVDFN